MITKDLLIKFSNHKVIERIIAIIHEIIQTHLPRLVVADTNDEFEKLRIKYL